MTTTENGTEPKKRINRIAAELFAKSGYHATGIAELSEAVGLGRGALYYHIGSKESVLYEICIEAISQLIPPSRQVVDGDTPSAEKLRVMSRLLMRNIGDLQHEWTVFFKEHGSLTGDRRTEVMRARETYEGLWSTVLIQGAASGEFVAVEPIVVKGILGMFNYSYLWLRPGRGLSPEAIADLFVNVLERGLDPNR
ncbi:MAG: HTH-type transcriptional repressor KstR2 [Marmoricola sp.]|nr:HTH-type transcriptional repressor KstR2 [Marmoricola sp.]MCW2821929.1 HTH-type transcriptional repressor KstR2 [Marmoricola sp.]MCW2826961.1 HTH-type transcriptional repressor KstR2 [Marmoricola sp.]